MKSIKELYKIGSGPSSSHTMGPQKACDQFKNVYPDADEYIVTLYGSLAATGKGHLTDWIIKKTLGEDKTIILWRPDDEMPEHPNAMALSAIKDNKEIDTWTAYSIGGGIIKYKGIELFETKEVYPHKNFDEIKRWCIDNDLRLCDYVYQYENNDIKDFLREIWVTMQGAIKEGLNAKGVLPGDLKVERKANMLLNKELTNESQLVTQKRMLSVYAFAVNEVNACGGKIVTAPTCGASGVLPAVLKYMKEYNSYTDDNIIDALATAAVIGNVVKHNATISGAEAGCQAEVGTACSMAAAAHAELYKLSIEQIEYASEIALEHHLGLTCDPISGYVQIPCIERNAVAALRAVDASGLAYFLDGTRKISFDTVVETMYQTGIDLNRKYRETSEGGLAVFYKEGCY